MSASIKASLMRPMVAWAGCGAVALCLSLSGCAKDPKPRELAELEVMWQDPETRKVREVPGAEQYYADAYQFRLRSEEAYNEGDPVRAKEYALWSMIKYRTAQSVAQQFEAKAQFDASNARMSKSNPDVQAINQERNKLLAEVNTLERQVNVAKTRQDAAARRAAAQNNVSTGDAASASLNAQRTALVDGKLRAAQVARKEAMDVNAQEHDSATFSRADNVLKSAQVLRQSNPIPYDAIISSADSAVTLFQQAALKAKPDYKVQVAKSDPVARRQALANEASGSFGTSAVLSEPVAVRMIAERAYLPGSLEMSTIGAQRLKDLVALGKKYDEFNIIIEVYTSKGSATENLSVSQVRAQKLQTALQSGGIDASRIVSSKGLGQSNPRTTEKGSAGVNERFEVIFRSP